MQCKFLRNFFTPKHPCNSSTWCRGTGLFRPANSPAFGPMQSIERTSVFGCAHGARENRRRSSRASARTFRAAPHFATAHQIDSARRLFPLLNRRENRGTPCVRRTRKKFVFEFSGRIHTDAASADLSASEQGKNWRRFCFDCSWGIALRCLIIVVCS
jgi:hypothetical protein